MLNNNHGQKILPAVHIPAVPNFPPPVPTHLTSLGDPQSFTLRSKPFLVSHLLPSPLTHNNKCDDELYKQPKVCHSKLRVSCFQDKRHKHLEEQIGMKSFGK